MNLELNHNCKLCLVYFQILDVKNAREKEKALLWYLAHKEECSNMFNLFSCSIHTHKIETTSFSVFTPQPLAVWDIFTKSVNQ